MASSNMKIELDREALRAIKDLTRAIQHHNQILIDIERQKQFNHSSEPVSPLNLQQTYLEGQPREMKED